MSKALQDASLADLVVALWKKLEHSGAVDLEKRVVIISNNLDRLFEAMENGVLGLSADCADVTVANEDNIPIATIHLPKYNGDSEEE